MENDYKYYLDVFFNRILDLRHSASRINTVLKRDVELVTSKDIKFISGSALIISDWTEPTESGWEINFHTGVAKTTIKEDYGVEVNRIISSECCLAYAQAFEALEKYLKDCVYRKMKDDTLLVEMIKCEENITRERIPGGDQLFKWLTKACGAKFKESSLKNNKNIKFKQFWSVISEVRHAITHSSSKVRITKIKKSDYHLAVFKHLFNYTVVDDKFYHVELDYKRLDRVIKYIAEFGYQIHKCFSLNEPTESDNLSVQENTLKST
ncbi:hypothetical protein Q4E40_06035 [Pontibacter sp. BT731]|uniref:hypothetical protein n=1 Tax=Pontibacter coccineus TaxID=3063328 RepID=UPI0026E13BD7|nr:hypothetical protein [Pontibacter sp. BT731]MDO6389677.1 hypothetical protein [Pontibacter sp. BT731]